MIFVNMVIADGDGAYINRLAKWFRENRATQFQIMAFTEKESLLRFINDTKMNIDILLASENFLDPKISLAANTIILGQPVNPLHNELKHIDKYLPAPSLCSEVLSIISDFDQREWGNAGKSDLITCLSPEPRLKSTLALYLSKISTDNIYLNLESFPFYQPALHSYRNHKNLSDVLYHIKASKTNVSIALESAVYNNHNGISLIPPMDNPKDLWELSEKEIGIFIDTLAAWGRFKNVITDIELNAGPFINQWLKASSLILIPFEFSQINQIIRLKNMLIQNLPENKIKWILAGEYGNEDLPDDFNNLFFLKDLNTFSGDWTSITFDTVFLQNLLSLLSMSID